MTNKGILAIGVVGAAAPLVAFAFALLAGPMAADMQDRHAQRVSDCMRENTALPHLESNGRYVDHEAAAVQAIAQCPD